MADQSKYNAYKIAFRAQKYDLITLQVKKGRKDKIKAQALSKGMSLNAYINSLIDKDMND